MEPNVIAGTISTTIFALGNIPMLYKAFRTRDLGSYSYSYIVMNNIANLIHCFYVFALPLGPIWFLHGFYTVSALLMLFWYLWFEKGLKSLFTGHQISRLLLARFHNLRKFVNSSFTLKVS
jgi:uncharacterized protein with PQ loop repeat